MILIFIRKRYKIGLSFEIFCQKNIKQIIKALNIDPATIVDIGPYFRQRMKKTQKQSNKIMDRKNEGFQIDICIIRKGQIITAIECKFKENPIGTEVVQEMEQKIEKLAISRNTTLERVLISASGVTPELEASDYFHRILGLEEIFN